MADSYKKTDAPRDKDEVDLSKPRLKETNDAFIGRMLKAHPELERRMGVCEEAGNAYPRSMPAAPYTPYIRSSASYD